MVDYQLGGANYVNMNTMKYLICHECDKPVDPLMSRWVNKSNKDTEKPVYVHLGCYARQEHPAYKRKVKAGICPTCEMKLTSEYHIKNPCN